MTDFMGTFKTDNKHETHFKSSSTLRRQSINCQTHLE